MITDNQKSSNFLNRVLKVAILVSALALFFLILHYNNYRDRSPLPDKALCSTCHSMKANIVTWQVTAHNKIGCSKCHHDISLTNVVLKEVTNSYQKPIRKSKPIDNKRCANCHNTSRTITGPGDLIIPHNLHLEKQIDCNRCHSNVTHGKVATEVLLSMGKDPKDITLEEAKELTAIGNRVPMKECMSCHNNAKATDDCSACHSEKPVPSSHDADFVKYAHSNDAISNMGNCMKCHEYDVKQQAKNQEKNNTFDNQIVAARSNDFCQGCHQQRPITHDSQFIITHPRGVENDKSCLVCHDRKPYQLEVNPATDKIYCDTCHNNDSVHTAHWITQHPIDLKEKDPNSCFSCHTADSCRNCHDARGIKR